MTNLHGEAKKRDNGQTREGGDAKNNQIEIGLMFCYCKIWIGSGRCAEIVFKFSLYQVSACAELFVTLWCLHVWSCEFSKCLLTCIGANYCSYFTCFVISLIECGAVFSVLVKHAQRHSFGLIVFFHRIRSSTPLWWYGVAHSSIHNPTTYEIQDGLRKTIIPLKSCGNFCFL